MTLKEKIKDLKRRIRENEDKIEDILDRLKDLEAEVFGELEIEFTPDPYLLDPNKKVREDILHGTKTERLSSEELNISNLPKISVLHLCGLQGFNPMLGDTCPRCDEIQLARLAAEGGELAGGG